MSLRARPKVEAGDAIAFISAVQTQLKDVPEFYDQFLLAMSEYNSGRADVSTTVEAVVNVLHAFPDLLEGYNAFLPLPYEIHASRDPEDPRYSVIRIMTPTGASKQIKRIHADLWDIIEPKPTPAGDLMPLLKLLEDVEVYYRDEPAVYQTLLRTIQPAPDGSRDKFQMVADIEQVLRDGPPNFIIRFKQIMGV